MKKTAIIGMGVITKHYFLGLSDSQKLNLVAVCDKTENFASRELYSEYKYYEDYQKMLLEEKLDCVIISTPPASHYEIAKGCLSNGVNVIIEKPCVLEKALLQELIEMARIRKMDFQVMYHWQNGQEVEGFLSEYDKSKISAIKITVFDPYCDDKKSINDNKVKLEGAWIDSGVNALSFAKCFLDFNDVIVNEVKIERCAKTELPIYANVKLLIDGVEVEITVDWTKNMDKKESELTYDGRKILISHSEQTIFDGERILKFNDMVRLTRHYYNFFAKNIDKLTNLSDTIKIHDTLYQVRDMYDKTSVR